MNKETHLTWHQVQVLLEKYDKTLRYYGVPRGGAYISAMLNPVDTPEEADILIDDIIDSGETMEKYKALYPSKPFHALIDKRIDTQLGWVRFPWEEQGASEVEANVKRVIQYFDNGNREGLKDTPKRYVKFLREFLSPAEFNFTTFDAEGTDEIVLVKDIEFHSLCEHHLAPFFGKGHVAYIPNKRIVGISKLARCLDWYARGMQNQERITKQVAERLMHELDPIGVAVILEAHHTCMSMRGIKKQQSMTVTSCMKGIFKTEINARNELMKLIKS